MNKRMMLVLWVGIVGVIVGVTLAVLGYKGPVPALITSISGGWIGVAIVARFSNGVRDEMVVRVEHVSAYYAFNGTLYFICILVGVHLFSNLTLGVNELLLTLALFMSISYTLLKYVLLRRGKAE